MLLFHSPSGEERVGFTTRTRAVGFNGIAAITWDGDVLTMKGKSNVGARSSDMWPN